MAIFGTLIAMPGDRRQIEGRRGDHLDTERKRPVLVELGILHIGRAQHFQPVLGASFPIPFGREAVAQFLLDLLAIPPRDHGGRGLARTETGQRHALVVHLGDGGTLRFDLLARHLHANGSFALG
jgi:hypothetical protein